MQACMSLHEFCRRTFVLRFIAAIQTLQHLNWLVEPAFICHCVCVCVCVCVWESFKYRLYDTFAATTVLD